jgi:hypothetical protein
LIPHPPKGLSEKCRSGPVQFVSRSSHSPQAHCSQPRTQRERSQRPERTRSSPSAKAAFSTRSPCARTARSSIPAPTTAARRKASRTRRSPRRGTAFVGTVDLRGTGTPRTDKRLFFVLDAAYGGTGFVQALTNVQTIKVTEPLLEEPAEYLVDAVDLGNNAPALVTSIIGYDANTYAIYTRAKSGPAWIKIYGGGGAAM